MIRVAAIAACLLAVAFAPGAFGAKSSAESSMAADRCLRGAWRMGPAESTRMLQQLVGSTNVEITSGVFTAAFDARNMQYGSEGYETTGTSPDGLKFTAVSSFLSVMRYNTRAGRIRVLGGTTTYTVKAMRGTLPDGRTITFPGQPPVTQRIPSGGSVPYTCSRNRLRMKVPYRGVWMNFQRVRR